MPVSRVTGKAAGDSDQEKAGLKLMKQMMWKVANPAAQHAQVKLAYKLGSEASDKVSSLVCPKYMALFALGHDKHTWKGSWQFTIAPSQ